MVARRRRVACRNHESNRHTCATTRFEGWAETLAEAEALAASGAVVFQPCHERGVVGPMAGVVSPSMPLLVVRDAAAAVPDAPGGGGGGGDGTAVVACATLNEGLGKVDGSSWRFISCRNCELGRAKKE